MAGGPGDERAIKVPRSEGGVDSGNSETAGKKGSNAGFRYWPPEEVLSQPHAPSTPGLRSNSSLSHLGTAGSWAGGQFVGGQMVGGHGEGGPTAISAAVLALASMPANHDIEHARKAGPGGGHAGISWAFGLELA